MSTTLIIYKITVELIMAWDSHSEQIQTTDMTVDLQAPLQPPSQEEKATGATMAIVTSPSRLFRDALREVLKIADITVIADGASVAEVFDELGPHDWPDIGICSIEGHREQSLQELSAIGHAYKRYPGLKWTILDKSADPEVIQKAAQIGAYGFLLYDISSEILLRAIELVSLGQKLFPVEVIRPSSIAPETSSLPEISSKPAGRSMAVPERPPPIYDCSVSLSQREDQILQCLVNGSSNKAIARELSIAEATVKVHIKALLRKVKVANRTQVAVWALNREARTQQGEMAAGLPTAQQEPPPIATIGTRSSRANSPNQQWSAVGSYIDI